MINEYVSQVITPCFQLIGLALVFYIFLKSTDKPEPTKPVPYYIYRAHKVEDYVRFISRINRGQRWLENYAKRTTNAK